jgi:hypothetical protein
LGWDQGEGGRAMKITTLLTSAALAVAISAGAAQANARTWYTIDHGECEAAVLTSDKTTPITPFTAELLAKSGGYTVTFGGTTTPVKFYGTSEMPGIILNFSKNGQYLESNELFSSIQTCKEMIAEKREVIVNWYIYRESSHTCESTVMTAKETGDLAFLTPFTYGQKLVNVPGNNVMFTHVGIDPNTGVIEAEQVEVFQPNVPHSGESYMFFNGIRNCRSAAVRAGLRVEN